jgi:hypothetical protein
VNSPESEASLECATPPLARKASRAGGRALELAALGLARLRCGVAPTVLPENRR